MPTYSKDSKLKKEIESARLYDINWIEKRRKLLENNFQEMNKAYHPIINATIPLKLLSRVYINRAVNGILKAPVYGDPEAYMRYNPNSTYTKNAMSYYKKHGGTPDVAFNATNSLNGLAFTDATTGERGVYLKPRRSGSAAHELWHVGTTSTGLKSYTQIGSSYKDDPRHFATVKYLKQDPYIQSLIKTKKLDYDKPVSGSLNANNANYVWTPDEVLARRASLMHYLNWDPTKKATLKDVQDWRKKGLLDWSTPVKNNSTFYNTPNINLHRLSDETILHLINDVAQNNPFLNTTLVDDVQYAYKGGLIKKHKK